MKLLSIFTAFMLIACVFGNDFDENGILCDADLSNARMDLVVVVELTTTTLGDTNGLISTLLSYLYFLPLTNGNGNNGVRLALVTYGQTAVSSYSFDSIQNIYAFKKALTDAIATSRTSQVGNIRSALETAKTVIDNSKSQFVPAILLFATTYDDSGSNDPTETAISIKGSMTKIMTMTFTPSGGVSSTKIVSLATPGLAFNTLTTMPADTNNAFAALNCVCPRGFTQLVLDNYTKSYSECFTVKDKSIRPTVTLDSGSILVTVHSQARKYFIEKYVVGDSIPYMAGLTRANKDDWSWDTYGGLTLPYTSFPQFVTTPKQNEIYGYFNLTGLSIGLYADNGLNFMTYVEAIRASDFTKQH